MNCVLTKVVRAKSLDILAGLFARDRGSTWCTWLESVGHEVTSQDETFPRGA
jgi:hypothetical protein